MGLVGVLVDRASVVSRMPAGKKVEGRTIRVGVESTPFKCRLDVAPMSGQPDAAVGVPVVTRETSLMYGTHDLEGEPVVLNAGHRVHVISTSLGMDELWDVAGDPQPIRKKRRLLGWTVELQHVEVPLAVDS